MREKRKYNCRIFYRRTNNENHVVKWKYNLNYYSSTVTFAWSMNTVRESSLISFFSDGDPLCVFERRPENTSGGANRFAWVTSWSLSSVQTYRPYIVFQLPRGNMKTPLRPRIFCLWLVLGTYTFTYLMHSLLFLTHFVLVHYSFVLICNFDFDIWKHLYECVIVKRNSSRIIFISHVFSF